MTVERMVELLEIEKECVLRNATGECNRYCAGCDLLQDDSELHEMYTEAIALLKAQEPRVIELYEFENVLGRDVPLYFEQRDDISGWDIYSGLEKGTMDIITSAKWAEGQTWQREYYWKDWRCWTSRPTDAQREATPWMT